MRGASDARLVPLPLHAHGACRRTAEPAAQLCTSGISFLADGPRTLIGAARGWRGVGPLDAAVAEVKRFDLTADDTFLVIGCDGIWDVLSDQQVRSLPPAGTREYSRTSGSDAYPPAGTQEVVWALFRLSRH